MWNEKSKQLVADGKLVVIGVVQEQHAERAQLYKQWKQYEFPIAQDSITGLGLAVVPVPVLIDEYGYVLSARPKIGELEKLVARKTDAVAPAPVLDTKHVSAQWLKANHSKDATASALCAIGDSLLREGTTESVKEAINYYQKSDTAAVSKKDKQLKGSIMFRLGVAYRSLFDLANESEKDASDFSNASEFWSRALELNPNQYIWRRRIQQYGPRQIKPYPFYDWVGQAQKEIVDRGEVPVELTVPLSGAEIARPNRKFETTASAESNPDPSGKIDRDEQGLVKFHATVVPQKVVPGKTVRVHLRFEPEASHWNNEAEGMVVWIDDSDNGASSNSKLTHANAKEASSDEARMMEFEFQADRAAKGEVELKGYALYYVCTSQDGECLYRRQDFSITVPVDSKK